MAAAAVADSCALMPYGMMLASETNVSSLPPSLPMAPPPRPPCKGLRTSLGGPRSDFSEGPSESSANMDDKDTEDDFSTIPNLEHFYEQIAAKARLPAHPPGNGANANWVLTLARSYRRLSKEKRSRGRLRVMLRPGQSSTSPGVFLGAGACPTALARPTTVAEQPGWSSNTDDSGYEAGYETDADESEFSEWEGGPARHGHKRKLDALVRLTMRLSVVGQGGDPMQEDAALVDACAIQPPPLKTPRALGTRPVGQRFSLDQSEFKHSPSASASSTLIPASPSQSGDIPMTAALSASPTTLKALHVATSPSASSPSVAMAPSPCSYFFSAPSSSMCIFGDKSLAPVSMEVG